MARKSDERRQYEQAALKFSRLQDAIWELQDAGAWVPTDLMDQANAAYLEKDKAWSILERLEYEKKMARRAKKNPNLVIQPNPWDEKYRKTNSPCSRCGGAGKIDSFSHVQSGTCFKCGGSGLADKNWMSEDPEEVVLLGKKVRIYNIKKGLYALIRDEDYAPHGTPALLSVDRFLGSLFLIDKGKVYGTQQRVETKATTLPSGQVRHEVVKTWWTKDPIVQPPNTVIDQYLVGKFGAKRVQDNLWDSENRDSELLAEHQRARQQVGAKLTAALQAWVDGKK